MPRFGFGLGVTMVAALVLLTVAMVDRQRFLAEAQITANAAPIPMFEANQVSSRDVAGQVVTATVPTTQTRVSNSLAQSDSAPLSEAPGRARSLQQNPLVRRLRQRLWYQPRHLD